MLLYAVIMFSALSDLTPQSGSPTSDATPHKHIIHHRRCAPDVQKLRAFPALPRSAAPPGPPRLRAAQHKWALHVQVHIQCVLGTSMVGLMTSSCAPVAHGPGSHGTTPNIYRHADRPSFAYRERVCQRTVDPGHPAGQTCYISPRLADVRRFALRRPER